MVAFIAVFEVAGVFTGGAISDGVDIFDMVEVVALKPEKPLLVAVTDGLPLITLQVLGNALFSISTIGGIVIDFNLTQSKKARSLMALIPAPPIAVTPVGITIIRYQPLYFVSVPFSIHNPLLISLLLL